MTVKGFFKGLWEGFNFLFLTPSWGSKRRREQQAYEERLDEAMERCDASVEARLRQWMADEGVMSVTDYGTYTPEYIYKQWNGEVSLWQIKRAMKKVASEV